MFHSQSLRHQAQWSVLAKMFCMLGLHWLNMKIFFSRKSLFANARKLNRVNLTSNSGAETGTAKLAKL